MTSELGPDGLPLLSPTDRPVMDQADANKTQAESNKRRQDIIEAARGIVLAGIALLPLLWVDLITAQQMGGLLILVGAVFVALQVILGRRTLKDAQAQHEAALAVEAQVTPINNPRDDAGNMLTPGTIGNDEADLPSI